MRPIYKNLIQSIVIISLIFSGISSANAAAGNTTRISVNPSRIEGNGLSRFGSVSANGRFVVFESDANNFVSDDTNGSTDIFVKDRFTNEVTRISVDSSGLQANNNSSTSAISADGRFVTFASDASNLVTGDTNNISDIFLHDRQLGITIRVSVSSTGEQANNNSSTNVSISSDGRFVAFQSNASNLVVDDTNAVTDVFVHDTQTGMTELISRTSDGAVGNGISFDPSISADGNEIAFTSAASNLDGNDTNNTYDVFVRRRSNAQTTRVSINSQGIGADLGARSPSISGDGRYVVFSSTANNLMNQDTAGLEYVYIRDRQTGSTTLASIFSDGNLMVGRSENATISADGRIVAFEFDDKGDGLPIRWIYVRDLFSGQTLQATSRPEEGTSPFAPSLSGDGSILIFSSTSSNHVSGDTNGVHDVFAYEVLFPTDTFPTVSSLQPVCGVGCSPSASTATFTVVFSEPVNGVTADDFSLTTTGSIVGAVINDVTGVGNTYTINVNTGMGDGSIRVDVIDNDSIQDLTLNSLGGAGVGNGNFNTGAVYMIDKSIPSVISIQRADADPTENIEVKFNVTFSESVNGVDRSDFTVSTIGNITGASISNVSGFGNLYTVSVNTGSGDGALHIDLIDDDSILDNGLNALGGVGIGNGNFNLDESYSIDKNAPTVMSILQADVNPTSLANVRFIVTFSEAVRNLDLNDFVLTVNGLANVSLMEISRADNIYTITVNTGTGNGTLRLDIIDDDSILDFANHPLGGVGIGNGNFIIGATYTVNKLIPKIESASFRSTGTNDGWILEAGEDSNSGGSKNSSAGTFKLGDDNQDRQYRAILHFPTYYLPDQAVVTRVILTIRKYDGFGTDPFTTHQNIVVDIRNGMFGNFNFFSFLSLELNDFLAPASIYSVGMIQNNPAGDWYWTMLDPTSFSAINLTSITQIRLGFLLDDNDDLGEDSIRFYSGDAIGQRDRPHLLVEYYVPK